MAIVVGSSSGTLSSASEITLTPAAGKIWNINFVFNFVGSAGSNIRFGSGGSMSASGGTTGQFGATHMKAFASNSVPFTFRNVDITTSVGYHYTYMELDA